MTPPPARKVVSDRILARIRYPVDVAEDGMWHAVIVRSPYASARVTGIDTSDVRDAVVLTYDDVAVYGRYGAQIADQFILASHARHIGDPVAAVAAPTLAGARAAAAALFVGYEELPAVFDERAALDTGAILVHDEHSVSGSDSAYFAMRPVDGTNICHRFRIRTEGLPTPATEYDLDPDPDLDDDGFGAADVVLDETFRMPAAQHVPMEPHACLACWDGDGLTLTTGTQTPFNIRQDLARLFSVPEEQVRVVCPPMGGTFGAKTFVRIEAIAAALARKAGRPVKIVLDRDEEWVTLNRHPATVRIRLGAANDGRFVAKRVWCWVNTGAYADCGPGVAQKMGYAGVGPYRFDHVSVDSYCIYTHLPPAGAYRGYGATQSVWASERVTDMMADVLGVDPVELRRRNLLRDGDRFCTGEIMHDTHFEELLDDAAGHIDWSAGRRGKGIAVMLKGMQTPSRSEVTIRNLRDGRFEVLSGTVEMGQGASDALAIMAAELLGVTPECVSVPPPDTSTVPYDTRTTSSRSTHMMSRALADAVRDLNENGTVTGVGHGCTTSAGGLDPDTGQGTASSHWHQGAAAAHVDVDPETGLIRLKALHASTYAGKIVNPLAADLQNEGSMIMAVGSTLFEEVTFDEGGVVGPNLSDYNIPSALDVAAISHTVMESGGAEVHGLGETALPPVPPAIGNAVASLGYYPRVLPMTPERVLACRMPGWPPGRNGDPR